MKTLSVLALGMKIAYLFLTWVREKSIEGRLSDENTRRFKELDSAYRDADPDSVWEDDPDLFRD